MENKKKKISIKGIIAIIIIVAFATLTFWGTPKLIQLFTLVFLYISLAQMWNLLGGYSGLVSLGQQIFVGLGGYCLAILTQQFSYNLVVAMIASVVISVVFALIMSMPIFKMKGVYFTIGTWVFAEALMIYFTNWKFVNYAIGYNITLAYEFSPRVIYIMAFIIGVGSVVLVYGILRSKLGLALMSMRDNEDASEVRGVKLYRTKLTCFLIAAAYTGLTGAVLYLNLVFIKPGSAFSIDWTVSMVFMVIIGGIGTIEGPILGAVLFVIIRQYLYNFPGFSMVILGVIAVLMILLMPKGIMGTLHDKFGFEVFSVRRKIIRNEGVKATLQDILS